MCRNAIAPLCWKERSWYTKSSQKFAEIPALRQLRVLLLDFPDLHILVDAENRVANRGVRRSRSVSSGDHEVIAAAAADFVGVAVALGSGEIHEAR